MAQPYIHTDVLPLAVVAPSTQSVRTVPAAGVTGTADDIALALSNGPALTDGLMLGFLPEGANTGSVTINYNSGGAIQLLDASGGALAANALTITAPILVRYDSTATKWRLVSGGGVAARDVVYYGADRTGSVDSRAAFAAADTAGDTIIPAGTYKISSHITITNSMTFAAGAKLSIDSGVVVTMNGRIIAPPTQIISGAGVILVNYPTDCAYVEWWGALGDGSTSDTAAFNACFTALQKGGLVQLGARGYKLSTAVTISNHCITLLGVAAGASPYDFGGSVDRGTRLLGANGVNCITVSAAGYVTLQNLQISIATGATTACIGIVGADCFLLKIVDCRTTNFSTGVKITNCTDTYVDRCYLSEVNSTVNPCVGFDIDGTTNQNPSVYISNTIAAHQGFSGAAYGFYIHGDRINDITLASCETAGCTYGFYLNGSAVDAGYGGDIHFQNCVADGNVVYGFFINSFSTDSMLDIAGGWVAGGTELIYIASSSGISITSMHLYGGDNAIYVVSSQRVSCVSNIINFQGSNGIVFDNSPCCTATGNIGYEKTAAGACFINVAAGSTDCTVTGNTCNAGVSGGYGIGVSIAADSCSVVGNAIPYGTAISVPYSLDLVAYPHTLFLDAVHGTWSWNGQTASIGANANGALFITKSNYAYIVTVTGDTDHGYAGVFIVWDTAGGINSAKLGGHASLSITQASANHAQLTTTSGHSGQTYSFSYMKISGY